MLLKPLIHYIINFKIIIMTVNDEQMVKYLLEGNDNSRLITEFSVYNKLTGTSVKVNVGGVIVAAQYENLEIRLRGVWEYLDLMKQAQKYNFMYAREVVNLLRILRRNDSPLKDKAGPRFLSECISGSFRRENEISSFRLEELNLLLGADVINKSGQEYTVWAENDIIWYGERLNDKANQAIMADKRIESSLWQKVFNCSK